MDGNGVILGIFLVQKKTHLRTFLTDPFRFISQVREPNLETTNSKNHQPPVPGTWDPCFAPTKKNFQTDSKLYFWCKLDYTHENERGSPLKRDYFSKQYIFHRDMSVFRRVPIWKKTCWQNNSNCWIISPPKDPSFKTFHKPKSEWNFKTTARLSHPLEILVSKKTDSQKGAI